MVLADLPTRYLTALEKLFADWDVPTVTVPTKRQRSDLYYEIDGHWNDSGHDFTANSVLGTIETAFLLPIQATSSKEIRCEQNVTGWPSLLVSRSIF